VEKSLKENVDSFKLNHLESVVKSVENVDMT
jgi:hypothetical protein